MNPWWPNPNSFCAPAHDRATELRDDEAALAALWADGGALILPFWKGSPASEPGEGGLRQLSYFRAADGQGLPEAASPPIFLGRLRGVPLFAQSWPDPEPPPVGAPEDYVAFRTLMGQLTEPDAALVAQARSLTLWHTTHRFCANCGQPTEPKAAGSGRRCAQCNTEHHPRVDPVVIMLPVHGDACLVGRQARHPAGMYSALAGYVEPGECLEDAVRREVREEAGIPVGRVAYVSNQPWPFPSTLMLGFYAEALHRSFELDGRELEDARWLSREDVLTSLEGRGPVWVPPRFAIAHHLLRVWAQSGWRF